MIRLKRNDHGPRFRPSRSFYFSRFFLIWPVTVGQMTPVKKRERQGKKTIKRRKTDAEGPASLELLSIVHFLLTLLGCGAGRASGRWRA